MNYLQFIFTLIAFAVLTIFIIYNWQNRQKRKVIAEQDRLQMPISWGFIGGHVIYQPGQLVIKDKTFQILDKDNTVVFEHLIDDSFEIRPRFFPPGRHWWTIVNPAGQNIMLIHYMTTMWGGVIQRNQQITDYLNTAAGAEIAPTRGWNSPQNMKRVFLIFIMLVYLILIYIFFFYFMDGVN